MTVMKYLRNCGFISYLIDVSACCGDGDGDSAGVGDTRGLVTRRNHRLTSPA